MPACPRILLCTDDTQWGGVAQYNHAILTALAARGYDVACAGGRAVTPWIQRQVDLGVRHLWLREDPAFAFERSVTATAEAAAILREAQPDLVIFSNGTPCSLLAFRTMAIAWGIPHLVVEGAAADYLADLHRELLPQVRDHYRYARQVIAVSHENLRCLRRRFGLGAAQGQVIYYGRPAEYFAPVDVDRRAELRRQWRIPPDGLVAFTAGRLHPTKGYQHQLAALDLLQNDACWSRLHCVWAGGGQLEGELRRAIAARGWHERIRLLGRRDDVVDCLDGADVFVLPTEAEGMPLAVMEAMARGLPVAASAVNGIPEQLGPTGVLLPDPTVEPQATALALAAALRRWAQEPALLAAEGQAGRARAERLFREERMVAATLPLIDRALLPAGDYVSPNLSIVRPDGCFPHLAVGEPQRQRWPHLRREIPHNWYVDRRWPSIGFLSRDEAHLLYHNARQFAGRPALEIGCWLGWSACHAALAGVQLDVVDPLLERAEIRTSVAAALAAAGVKQQVHLRAGSSPAAVAALAQTGRRWSFFLIDGDHEGSAPEHDAAVCERYATADALVLFHDLAAPAVGAGLEYFRRRGWRTMVYHTMQLMGVAWRGDVTPVRHEPDPAVTWWLPEHLAAYSASVGAAPVPLG